MQHKPNNNKIKKLITLFLCCFLAITVNTVEAGNPSNNKKKVTLKTTPYKALGGMKRSPILPIYAFQDGNLLIFDASLEGANIDVVSDEMVIFSTHIDENGSVELPESLEGEFELRLYVGENVFSGLIVL